MRKIERDRWGGGQRDARETEQERERETKRPKERRPKGRKGEKQKIEAAGLRVAEDPCGEKSPARGGRYDEKRCCLLLLLLILLGPSFPSAAHSFSLPFVCLFRELPEKYKGLVLTR